MDSSLFTAEAVSPATLVWRRVRAVLRPWRWLRTLKARLVVGAMLALFAGMATTAWHMGRVAESYILLQAQEREHIEAQQIAALVGHRVAEMQRGLRLVADALDPALLNDPPRLAAFLDGKPLLRMMFSGVAVADATGHVRGTASASAGGGSGASSGSEREALSFIGDRDYFQRAMATGRPVISDPLLGRVRAEPMVVFAQPLVRDGVVLGVLAGGVRLASRDLIGYLAEAHDIDDNLQTVITDDAGRILAHPQQAFLLRGMHTDARLTDAAALWVQAGRPLIGGAGALSGPGDVVSMAGEPQTGWHVWRVGSRDALLAPLREARATSLRLAGVVAVLLAAALGAFLAWQLLPLARLERRAAALMQGDDGGAWPVADGEIGRLARTLRHVWAERAQVEQFNAQVLQKFASVMAAAPVGLAFTRNQRYELVSDEFCRVFGRSEAELVGQPGQIIFASNADYMAIGPQVGAAFAAGQPYKGDWRMLHADGSVFWARLQALPVSAGDASAGTIWSLYDVTDQLATQTQLEHAAQHDPLTGVRNRQGFDRIMARLLVELPGNAPASVVMIDLDHFKPINDSAGHAAGDAMLQAVAQAMLSKVRATDHVARLGGDEFALLLPGCDQQRALQIAQKVQAEITAIRLHWSGRELQVGASLGIAEWKPEHADAAAWLADADAECYAAKHAGRGTICGATGAPRLQLVDNAA
jgi:diguanylate cyclase (GGDEF)-like protein/PAS domain S-box-containing protein